VEEPGIQKCLLAKPKFTSKRATEIAIAIETAETLKQDTTGDNLPKQSIYGVFQAGKKGVPTKPTVCYRCGQKFHKTKHPIRKPSVTSVGSWDTSRR